MSDLAGLAWFVVLLLGNAFFVAAEFAVISARRSQVEPLADAGKRGARTAIWAMEHATLMLAMSQLGITICSLLILNVSEPAIHHLLEAPLHASGLPDAAVSAISFAIALVLVSALHVVFGEMVPKNLSFARPDRAVLLLAPPLVWCARVFKPVIIAMNASANAVLRLFGVEPKSEAVSAFTLEEVQTIVNQSRREGVLNDASGTLSAAFEFTAKRVHDIALPLDKLVTLPPGATPGDVERAVAQHGFSRYVLLGDDGEPDGYVHLKDVIDLDEDEFDDPLPAKRVRRLQSIFEETELEDALATFRRAGGHVARSFAADGSTTGVLFLEDIIEELVGEVQDATQR
ncbi:MAG TPA: hemolysin family protein [Candidatus Lumbricidophila sp.]|nr:hemolysin family protein [Candidatus Lumbricidophila sp.]